MPQHTPGSPANGDNQPSSHDRCRLTSLTPTEITGLQHALARQQRRRHAYRAGPLQVWWDGAAQGAVDPREGVCEPLRVPLGVSCVEIVGDDAEGALLLAVFPLPEPDVVKAEGGQHVSVTLEGGQTVALTLALGQGSDGKAPTYVIQLAYTASTTVPALLVTLPPERSRQPQEGG
jgi:hypothetical protein